MDQLRSSDWIIRTALGLLLIAWALLLLLWVSSCEQASATGSSRGKCEPAQPAADWVELPRDCSRIHHIGAVHDWVACENAYKWRCVRGLGVERDD